MADRDLFISERPKIGGARVFIYFTVLSPRVLSGGGWVSQATPLDLLLANKQSVRRHSSLMKQVTVKSCPKVMEISLKDGFGQ